MIGNISNRRVAPIFRKSGIISKVCTSLKVAETRGVLTIMDDAMNVAEQLKVLLNAWNGISIFKDSRPLL